MEMSLFLLGAIAMLAIVILSTPNNRIKVGSWLIASAKAQHEKRIARHAINNEAAVYQRTLEAHYRIAEPRPEAAMVQRAEAE